MNFKETVLKSHPTGSRYMCNPPPTDTDNDTVFLVNGYYDWAKTLLDDNWVECGDYISIDTTFRAFRKGEENYICTEDPAFYLCYLQATEAGKALNLLNKEDRIKLFHAIQETGMDGLRTDVHRCKMYPDVMVAPLFIDLGEEVVPF